ncbi:apolipoprotein N-acyltransferase [Aliidiomarina sp. Khilg15.8]
MNWFAVLTNPRWRYLLSLGAGLLMTFAYAPFQQGWLAPLCIAAWLLMLVRAQTQRQALATGFAFGFGWFGAGISWVFVSIDQFGGVPLVVSILLMVMLWAYLALYPMLAAWLWFRLRPYLSGTSLLALPLLWLITEAIRGWLFTGFPWLSLGYTQTSAVMGNLAPHIGEIGVSVLVLLAAIGFALTLLRKRLQWLLVPLACYALGVAAPYFNPMQPTGETTQVALVQGNIELDIKWDPRRQWINFDIYKELAEPYYDHDLVIWPESAITAIEPFAGSALHELDRTARDQGTAIITGILDRKGIAGDYYNSIVVLGDQPGNGYQYGSDNRYEKHQLLPIGEFVPFEDILRPLAPLFNLPMSSFHRGHYHQHNLQANGYQIAANICYEVAFANQIAANVDDTTQLLLTISNDSWFGDSHGPHQHLEIARMRARELGRPMLRATNSGVTEMIDERGYSIERLPQFTAAVASARVALVEGTTLFRQLGQWPAWLLALFAALVSWQRRQQN